MSTADPIRHASQPAFENKQYSPRHRPSGKQDSAPPAEHGGVRFELTAGSAGEQAEGHVSEVEVQVNHFVNEILSDVERCEVVRGVEPDDSVQITDSAAAGLDAGPAENVGDQQIGARSTAGPDRPVRDCFVPNGWHSGGGAQDFGFCAAISDLQLAENLFMSIPALTQSFIS